MKNPKEDAIVAVVAQLKKIKRANGYATDVEGLFRVDLTEDQIAEARLPALLVLDDASGEEFEPFDQGYRSRLRLLIGGMISVGETDLTADTRVVALNWLLRDAITALMQDPTFGKKVKDSVLSRAVTAVDSDRGFAFFGMNMHCTYYLSHASLVA